jgi:hypothetical protein
MPDCVHPAMNAVQAPRDGEASQALALNAEPSELIERHHPVLIRRNPGDLGGIGEFLTHVRE